MTNSNEWSMQYPEALWSEILPGLWQGGTHDNDVQGKAKHAYRQQADRDNFDSVYTMAGWANGAGANVKEMRFAIEDGDMLDFDAESDLWPLVESAHADWKAGKRVLIRCRAGLNRSGLVMALVLIREGFSAEAAIELIREKRGDVALCNYVFVDWLLHHADTRFWRAKVAA